MRVENYVYRRSVRRLFSAVYAPRRPRLRGVNFSTVLALFCLSACSLAFRTPENVDMPSAYYQNEQQHVGDGETLTLLQSGRIKDDRSCPDLMFERPSNARQGSDHNMPREPVLFSRGDLIRIDIIGGRGFAGDYVVNADGHLNLPYLRTLPAAGLTYEELNSRISQSLIEGGYFQSEFISVSTAILQWAPIQVHVSGAVYTAGDVVLNQRRADEDHVEKINSPGDFTVRRSLSAALYAAAGVRPDADIRNIIVTRQGREINIDLKGAFDGDDYHDLLLFDGDRVHVPSRGCFQANLARPSRVTPPGVRVFMSNLVQPAAGNAAAAIGQTATSLPYGTRFLAGLVSANCVGGVQATNAERWGVLISHNPITQESIVIAREIEVLVRRSYRDDYNPVLLPGDAIACYDSHLTNVRDVLSLLAEAVAPVLNAAVIGDIVR